LSELGTSDYVMLLVKIIFLNCNQEYININLMFPSQKCSKI